MPMKLWRLVWQPIDDPKGYYTIHAIVRAEDEAAARKAVFLHVGHNPAAWRSDATCEEVSVQGEEEVLLARKKGELR